MTDKELRKLTRAELLEILLAQSREIDRLNTDLERIQQQLQKREIALTSAGNIAEAALLLNGVFEAAQAAADQYLENIMSPVMDTETQCSRMLDETRQQCSDMLQATAEKSRAVWEVIRQEIFNPKLDYAQWQQITEYIDRQLTQK